MTEFHLESVPMVLEQYSAATSPFHLCPPLLFAEIMRVNHLRHLSMNHEGIAGLSQQANDILQRIQNFSPEQWAETKHSTKDVWALVGNAYRLAAGLYCMLSMQSSSVFPRTTLLRDLSTSTGRDLRRVLTGALSRREINRFMLWPLVTLGVQAKSDATMRGYVSRELTSLSSRIGTCSPLTAKNILERFWASGEDCWDACFDRSYVFTMQIAVDTSQIIASL